MRIHLAADHAGYELKEYLKKILAGEGHDIIDHGADIFDDADDYPDYIVQAAQAVAMDQGSTGIIIGGSGQGEAMAANRIPRVRAAVFYGPRQASEAVDASGRTSNDPMEIVRLAREHNNANILSLGARFITKEEAEAATVMFLATPFSDDERHVRRISKIDLQGL